MRGLYAIVDVTSLERAGLELEPFAEAVLSSRPAALQLRDKSSARGGRAMLERLRALQPMCTARGVPLFANDRVDLALLAGTDGVHVGQNDLPGSLARELLLRGRGGLVGISAHSKGDVERAIAERPDYVALGPVYGTASKVNPEPTIGLFGLEDLAKQVHEAGLPTVAIGGVTLERVDEVARRSPCVAVIGALLPQPQDGEAEPSDPYADVAARATALDARIRRAFSDG